jgi:multidrug efflux pump subunit AcrA (membrane-fusion protein)
MSKRNYLEMMNKDIQNEKEFKSFESIHHINRQSKYLSPIKIFFLACSLILFLPWTQHVKFKGYVTSLEQENRPQQLNSVIPGKIVKWYVKEGSIVKKGDTILQIGEVKEDYLDPQLLQRTRDQILAKQKAIGGYEGKINMANSQYQALFKAKELKLKQIKNKIEQQKANIKIDSANLEVSKAELIVYQRQNEAGSIMLDKGAISLVDYEKRKVNYQNGLAKFENSENKLKNTKQELRNLILELDNTEQEYNDKLAKVEGDRYGSVSNSATAEYDLAKLENIYTNYDKRRELYFVLSPIDGQVGKVKKAGIGMILKEGEFIADILPIINNKAVEIFIDPLDIPLVKTDQKIQFVFDGFPAMLFSGWPQMNYGTFSGKINIIENAASNGKFRALVVEDENARKWPEALSIGGGAHGIALLNDVPIYYEIWRQINGFPPDFYYTENKIEVKK